MPTLPLASARSSPASLLLLRVRDWPAAVRSGQKSALSMGRPFLPRAELQAGPSTVAIRCTRPLSSHGPDDSFGAASDACSRVVHYVPVGGDGHAHTDVRATTSLKALLPPGRCTPETSCLSACAGAAWATLCELYARRNDGEARPAPRRASLSLSLSELLVGTRLDRESWLLRPHDAAVGAHSQVTGPRARSTVVCSSICRQVARRHAQR
jgi:hypothetical protein